MDWMNEVIASIVPSVWQFLTLLFLMFESLVVAYVIVYNPMLRITQVEAFNIAPFTCLKCSTFWTNLIQNILLAYIWTPMFAVWGLITAGTLAYMVWFSYERQ